jgi:hypothetical protein
MTLDGTPRRKSTCSATTTSPALASTMPAPRPASPAAPGSDCCTTPRLAEDIRELRADVRRRTVDRLVAATDLAIAQLVHHASATVEPDRGELRQRGADAAHGDQ